MSLKMPKSWWPSASSPTPQTSRDVPLGEIIRCWAARTDGNFAVCSKAAVSDLGLCREHLDALSDPCDPPYHRLDCEGCA
jgi:hypothetical protein